MGHSKYVGRIGALALALGVGIGLGAAPGVAVADDTDSSASASADEGTSSKTRGPAHDRSAAPGHSAPEGSGDAAADDDRQAGDSASGDRDDAAAHDGRDSTETDLDEDALTPTVDEDAAPEPAGTDVTPGTAPEAPTPEVTSPAEPAPTVPAVITQTPAPSAPAVSTASETTSVTVSSILSSLLNPTGAPDMPTESPALWVLLAAARRQLGQSDPAFTALSREAVASALLTPDQAAAIYRLGDILVGDTPTDVAASDTRAYVANAGGKSISVIDTLTGTVVDTIALRSAPTMLALSPIGNRLYVTNSAAGTVSVVSTLTNTVIKTLRVGINPTGIALSPLGTTVYVANSGGSVTKISTATLQVVGTVFGVAEGASSIAVSTDGSRIFTTSSTSGDVSYFTPLSLFADTISGVTPGSVGIAFNADGSRVFVADVSGSVKIIDTTSHEVVDSITVAAGAPFDIAVSPDGTTLFVARADDGKLSAFDIASKTELTSVVANPYLIDGPPAITVSPDGTQLYWTDTINDRIHVISLIAPNANPEAGTPVVNAPNASGVVTGSVTVTDADGNPLSFTVNKPGSGTVTVTQTGDTFAFTYTPTAAARHAASADGAAPELKSDTFVITIRDSQRGVVEVPIVVAIAPANAAPTATVRSNSSWFSANVYGTVAARDADRDALTYSASATAKGGTVTMDDDGTFTYTPTAAARHAAANANATSADKQDTFTVLVDDGHGGFTTVAVTVKVKPGNAKPAASVRTTASWFSATVYGTLTVRDAEGDPLSYTASPTEKGGEVVFGSRGRFTYTPTDAARHAAAAAGATDDDKQDVFDIVIDDGHGGVTTLIVRVPIKPANVAPTGLAADDVDLNPNTGVVTGKVVAVDADGDGLTYRSSEPRKGSLTLEEDGTFTYTPTDEARAAASTRFAPSWDRTDRFQVTVDDGHGGIRTLTVRVDIAPLGHQNQAPTGAEIVVGEPNSINGKVSGLVTATDPEGDTLIVTGSGLTSKGTVIVAPNGEFVYTPSDDARHQAGAENATLADKQDTLSIRISDSYGGTLDVVVTVSIQPSVNKAPTNGSFTAAANLVTGVVIGGATASDANNDPLVYSGSTSTAKGSVVVETSGGFEYTPTTAARVAAGALDAPDEDKKDNFTIFVKDGHGGTLAIPVTVTVVGLSAVAV